MPRNLLAAVIRSEKVRLDQCGEEWVRIKYTETKGCYMSKWAEIRVVWKSHLKVLSPLKQILH